jgi:hypothetical protein
MVMILVLLLIIIIVCVNIYVLRSDTVQQIDTTLDKQSKNNMIMLAKEAAVLMYAQIAQVTTMFELIQFTINEMFDPQTYSMAPLRSYTSSQLPEKCWVFDASGEEICEIFSSYFPLNNTSTVFLALISSLDNIWPEVWKLTGNIALRYYLYFYEANVFKTFPGTDYPKDYNPLTLNWLVEANKTRNSAYATGPYQDSRTGYEITTIVYPIFDMANQQAIGMVAADLPFNQSSFLLKSVWNVQYLKTGFVSVAYRDGTLIDKNSEFWGPNANLAEINKQLWKNLTNNPNETYFFIRNDNIYRISNYPVSINLSHSQAIGEDAWFRVMMIVEEGDIMKYRDSSKSQIDSSATILLIITLTCSVFTILIVTVLIYFLSKTIAAPLKGIIEFTNKINSNAMENDAVTKEELDNLKEGEEQIAELVRTYKELAGTLITKDEERIPKPMQAQHRVYPRNELHKKNRFDWNGFLAQLPSDN